MPSSYHAVSPFREGYALVETENGRLKYIHPDGTTAVNLPEDCTAAGNFSEGKAWVCIDGRYGFINTTGTIVIDTIFSYASDFNDGMAYVAYGERQGIIRHSRNNDSWPDMRIESVRLADSNGDGQVESGESFKLDVVLKNYGREAADGITVTLSGDAEQARWFTYGTNQLELESLAPGESTTVSFEGKTNMDLVSEDISVSFKAMADNQFNALTCHLLGPHPRPLGTDAGQERNGRILRQERGHRHRQGRDGEHEMACRNQLYHFRHPPGRHRSR